MTITYRGAGPWGAGKGSDLLASEIDGNVYDLDRRLSTVETSRPQPNNIASITASGTALTFMLADGTTIGPVPVPILQFRWRGDWQPSTFYAELDTFRVAGIGLYTVLIDHTSVATFDEAATDTNGNPLYFKLFGFAPPARTASKTADYAISATADVGVHFNNIGAAGAVTLTLPAAAAGLQFGFLVGAAQTLQVLAPASDRIANGTDNSAAGGNIQSNAPYSFVQLEAHAAGQWIVTSQTGAWTLT